jgi:hypothetical protein
MAEKKGKLGRPREKREEPKVEEHFVVPDNWGGDEMDTFWKSADMNPLG